MLVVFSGHFADTTPLVSAVRVKSIVLWWFLCAVHLTENKMPTRFLGVFPMMERAATTETACGHSCVRPYNDGKRAPGGVEHRTPSNAPRTASDTALNAATGFTHITGHSDT
jgi:hypothetical protein